MVRAAPKAAVSGIADRDEQEQGCNSHRNSSASSSSAAARLAVQAGAGAAKTTTLCAYAQARPECRVLYVAFNKAIQLEAATRMPANVSARTTHSLAYRKARDLFGDRAGERIGSTYPSTVSRAFGCTPLAATAALQAIQKWCGSLEAELGSEHLPVDVASRLPDPAGLVALARAVWNGWSTRTNTKFD
jgi:F-box protein 18 (helicase)